MCNCKLIQLKFTIFTSNLMRQNFSTNVSETEKNILRHLLYINAFVFCTKCLVKLTPLRCQFHQRFTRSFFVRKFVQSQNVSWKKAFIRKIRAFNIDEIDYRFHYWRAKSSARFSCSILQTILKMSLIKSKLKIFYFILKIFAALFCLALFIFLTEKVIEKFNQKITTTGQYPNVHCNEKSTKKRDMFWI